MDLSFGTVRTESESLMAAATALSLEGGTIKIGAVTVS